MGSFVDEAGSDVSLRGKKVKSSEDNNFKVDTTNDQGVVKSSPVDGKSPRSANVQQVDENQGPLKEVVGYNKPGELDYVQKCNGNPDSQIYENGDGDLPSFSIKRLRRLPLRVTSDQQASALASAVDPNRPNGGRGEELVAGSNGDEKIKPRQALPNPRAVVTALSSSNTIEAPEQVLSSFDSSRSKNFTSEPPLNVSKGGTSQGGASGVQNGEIHNRIPEEMNPELAVEEPGSRNPNSGGDQSVSQLPSRRKEHAEDVEISEESKEVAFQHVPHSSITLEGESRSKLPQSHVSSPNPEVKHTAPVDGMDVSTSGLPSEIHGVSDKNNINLESPAPVIEDPNRDTLTDSSGKIREDVGLGASTKPAELPSPRIVQVLPPVMGSKFGSPGETTDEETDSPRSSEGFSYPDSDPRTYSYSGQIMYPSRFSCTQSSNGPNMLQYSGSMSLRSDSSTTSNRSFAFPILAPPEWNSSPVRMAKAHPRRKNRFDGCCFFRLNRSRYKY